MREFLAHFNADVGKEPSKQTVGYVSLHETSNDTRIRVVKFAISKN
jgi:hypothetical protein